MTKFTRNVLLRRMRKGVSILLLFFFIFVIFFNNYIKNELRQDAKDDLLRESLVISKEVNGHFIQYSEVIRQMLTNHTYSDYVTDMYDDGAVIEDHPDYASVVSMLVDVQASDQDVAYVWLGLNKLNTLLTHNVEWQAPDGYDIPLRPWYIKMHEEGTGLTFSDPYIGAGTNIHIMSIVAPIYSDTSEVGSVGIDINIDRINDFVNSYKIGKEGYAFLLSDRGELVVSYDTHRHIGHEVLSLKDQIQDIHSPQVIEYDYEGEAKYISIAPVTSTGWVVASVIPKSETQTLIDVFNGMSIIIIVASLIIMLIFETIYRLSTDFENLNQLYGKLQEQEEEIKKIAYIDPLTEIPNRRNFIERLENSIQMGEKGAVLLLDIDNFKEINDTFGHIYGDEVLKEVSTLLKNLESEDVFISRFGGDEFLVQINGHDDYEQLEAHIQSVAGLFKRHIHVSEEDLFVSVSIGVTLYPKDSVDVNQLIINADLSMYDVKNNGKGDYAYFKKSMTNRLKEKAYIEKELRRTLKEKAFRLVYQPQICGETGNIIGFEALLRMKDGLIPPDKFIPVAEETGLILDVGRRVTKAVIKQLALLKDEGHDLKPIAINFSVKQLKDQGYISFLSQELKRYAIDPKYLEIEITESVMIDNETETLKFLTALKTLGVRLSLDDFGTGYTSLNYLTFLPVDKIKMDKSLSDKFLLDKEVSVIDNIIALAHSLDLKVVAEGIEKQEQFKLLKAYHCDYIQGYYFSKPCDEKDMIALYEKTYRVDEA